MTRYTLLSEVGRGGMGVVWRARDEESGEIVALKLIRDAYGDDSRYLARFAREAELAQRVRSENVVGVLASGVRDGVSYLALEYVDGPSLRERLADRGPLAWPEGRELLRQLAGGLADVHAAGILHRDLKPSNILLAPDGNAKLTDFGIARAMDIAPATAPSTLLGTPAYLPPEGFQDARSDLYSLGCVAYEFLTGMLPFEGPSYQEMILARLQKTPDFSRLPPEARPIVGSLLSRDPAGRPGSAEELVGLLEDGAPRMKSGGRRRVQALAVVVTVVAAVALVGAAAAGVFAPARPASASPTVSGSGPSESAIRSPTVAAAAEQTPGPAPTPPATLAPTPTPTPWPTTKPTARPTARPTSIPTAKPTPAAPAGNSIDVVSMTKPVAKNGPASIRKVAYLTVRWSYSGQPPITTTDYKVLVNVEMTPFPTTPCPAPTPPLPSGSTGPWYCPVTEPYDFGIWKPATGTKTLAIYFYGSPDGQPFTTTGVHLQLRLWNRSGHPSQTHVDKVSPLTIDWGT